MYINNLEDIVNQYNNIYHRKIKVKLVDVKTSIYLDFDVQNNDKILNVKLVTMREYQNIKIFLKKVTL